MDVPEDTNYVTLWRDAEENERRERREMVRLTLDISNRQQREEYEGKRLFACKTSCSSLMAE